MTCNQLPVLKQDMPNGVLYPSLPNSGLFNVLSNESCLQDSRNSLCCQHNCSTLSLLSCNVKILQGAMPKVYRAEPCHWSKYYTLAL